VVGDEWSLYQAAIESSPRAAKLGEARAFRDFARTNAKFEVRDWFLYPLAGFDGVERGGPDFILYRIRPPAAAASRTRGCDPPGVTVDRSGGRARIVLLRPAGCAPIAYYARFQPGPAPDREAWTPPILVPLKQIEVPVPENTTPGHYLLSVAAANLDGLGPWSAPIGVDLP
jgi:hypothetical protein